MRIRDLLLILVALPVAALSMPSSASAATCLTKGLEAVPQVAGEAKGQSFTVIVDDIDAPAFRSRGLKEQSCDATFTDKAEEADYRDRICALANFGNEAVQNQLTRALGLRPRELCETAQRALGPASEIAKTDPLSILQATEASRENAPTER